MRAFDLTGPLPGTTSLLEASAGTGKTYAIAALTTRFIAETPGLDITRVLLITFGNSAAAELRTRVFERLVRTLRRLEAHLAGLPMYLASDDPDAVDDLLASHDAEVHRDRIAAALRRFSETHILTIHAFCESLLLELGVLGDWDPRSGSAPTTPNSAGSAPPTRTCGSTVTMRPRR
ncbi:UvrD-helicase domain-containing protein [Tessaracoccus sp. HDW20]|uniref:UvrD-helicase domain-containing protein n=1 Tax=Tessaracoccus coleopterorum TaxID=2714950 RepID=UPI0018D36A3A|nr:UvrD-helicase domain-containing protein [Tessaracoccus coleopterorum]NHB85915.1 UvrD-helicase domain-containing protein [Tessaracoccus coleopterorum]